MIRLYRITFTMCLSAVGAILFTGCPEDDPVDPGDADTSQIERAAPGSSYEFEGINVDRMEDPPDTSSFAFVSTLKDTAASVSGRSNVRHLQDVYDNGDTINTYLVFESNDDVSILLDPEQDSDVEFGIEPYWVRVPFGSRTTSSESLLDTTMIQNQDTLHFTTDGDMRFLRTDTADVGGESIPVWVAQVELTVLIEVSGDNSFTFETEVTSEIWFAPSLGHAARIEEQVMGDDDDSYSLTTMTGYTIVY